MVQLKGKTMKKAIAACLAATILLTGCGGDGDQGEVADLIIRAAEDAGVSPDADCIRDAANKLSDDDAAAIADAGLAGDPTISDGATDILIEILSC